MLDLSMLYFTSMFMHAVELRESVEPAGTDHTGDIVSFTDVGSGSGNPRPWVCYTAPFTSDISSPHSNVEWQTPGSASIPSGTTPAVDNSIITRSFGGGTPGVLLARGTNYFSPDGDYCCVLTMSSTESERRCVTFSEY